jgi:hypothetical protein
MHVMVGMPLYGAPTTKTTISLLKTQGYCIGNGIRFDYTTSTGFVTVARDQILEDFLASEAERLFWIDGDMVWTPEDFVKFLAMSTELDVICATYPLKQEGRNQYPVYAPPEVEIKTGKFGLIEVWGAGLGFSIWSRKACQALSDSKAHIKDGLTGESRPGIFCVAPRNGELRTEDINVFEDLRALGFKVYLDPTIELGHVGSKEWRGSLSEYKEKA